MKKMFAALLLISLLLSCCACDNAEEVSNPFVDAYIDKTQEFIDSGDLDSAVAVLEEGIRNTNAPELIELLDQIKKSIEEQATDSQAMEPQTTAPIEEVGLLQEINNYLGVWTSEKCRLELTASNEELFANMKFISYRVLEYELAMSAKILEQEKGKIRFVFDDDGLGNSGVIVLYLDEDAINYVITDYVEVNDMGIQTQYGGDSLTRAGTGLDNTTEETMIVPESTVENTDGKQETESVLNKNNQKKINIFLSNFAEQCFEEYPVTDDYFLLKFAYTYSQINSPGLISYTDYSACMSKDDVDSILNRFFGRTIIPSDNSMFFSHPMSSEDVIAYGANTYEFIAATGEFRGYVAIVYDMEKNSDGTYDVLFDIYMTESDSLSKYYEMTAEEAEQSNGLSLYQHGFATVKDYTRPNGKETYQLISYSVY